jgi:exodeoxyribonuclease X
MLNLIYFDTETTSKDEGRIVQLAFKEDSNATEVLFFKPPVAIDIEAMAVHHITEKRIADEKPFEFYRDGIRNAFAGRIAVAHNAQFDIAVMAREGMDIKDFICTYKVVQQLYDLPMYKLQYLRYLWGIEIKATAHDAEGDVDVLAMVFDKMLGDYASEFGKREIGAWLPMKKVIEDFVKITNRPTLLRRCMFGKYRGKTFEEIYKENPQYLEWLKKQDELEPDLRFTVNYWLSGKQNSLL